MKTIEIPKKTAFPHKSLANDSSKIIVTVYICIETVTKKQKTELSDVFFLYLIISVNANRGSMNIICKYNIHLHVIVIRGKTSIIFSKYGGCLFQLISSKALR